MDINKSSLNKDNESVKKNSSTFLAIIKEKERKRTDSGIEIKDYNIVTENTNKSSDIVSEKNRQIVQTRESADEDTSQVSKSSFEKLNLLGRSVTPDESVKFNYNFDKNNVPNILTKQSFQPEDNARDEEHQIQNINDNVEVFKLSTESSSKELETCRESIAYSENIDVNSPIYCQTNKENISNLDITNSSENLSIYNSGNKNAEYEPSSSQSTQSLPKTISSENITDDDKGTPTFQSSIKVNVDSSEFKTSEQSAKIITSEKVKDIKFSFDGSNSQIRGKVDLGCSDLSKPKTLDKTDKTLSLDNIDILESCNKISDSSQVTNSILIETSLKEKSDNVNDIQIVALDNAKSTVKDKNAFESYSPLEDNVDANNDDSLQNSAANEAERDNDNTFSESILDDFGGNKLQKYEVDSECKDNAENSVNDKNAFSNKNSSVNNLDTNSDNSLQNSDINEVEKCNQVEKSNAFSENILDDFDGNKIQKSEVYSECKDTDENSVKDRNVVVINNPSETNLDTNSDDSLQNSTTNEVERSDEFSENILDDFDKTKFHKSKDYSEWNDTAENSAKDNNVVVSNNPSETNLDTNSDDSLQNSTTNEVERSDEFSENILDDFDKTKFHKSKDYSEWNDTAENSVKDNNVVVSNNPSETNLDTNSDDSLQNSTTNEVERSDEFSKNILDDFDKTKFHKSKDYSEWNNTAENSVKDNNVVVSNNPSETNLDTNSDDSLQNSTTNEVERSDEFSENILDDFDKTKFHKSKDYSEWNDTAENSVKDNNVVVSNNPSETNLDTNSDDSLQNSITNEVERSDEFSENILDDFNKTKFHKSKDYSEWNDTAENSVKDSNVVVSNNPSETNLDTNSDDSLHNSTTNEVERSDEFSKNILDDFDKTKFHKSKDYSEWNDTAENSVKDNNVVVSNNPSETNLDINSNDSLQNSGTNEVDKYDLQTEREQAFPENILGDSVRNELPKSENNSEFKDTAENSVKDKKALEGNSLSKNNQNSKSDDSLQCFSANKVEKRDLQIEKSYIFPENICKNSDDESKQIEDNLEYEHNSENSVKDIFESSNNSENNLDTNSKDSLQNSGANEVEKYGLQIESSHIFTESTLKNSGEKEFQKSENYNSGCNVTSENSIERRVEKYDGKNQDSSSPENVLENCEGKEIQKYQTVALNKSNTDIQHSENISNSLEVIDPIIKDISKDHDNIENIKSKQVSSIDSVKNIDSEVMKSNDNLENCQTSKVSTDSSNSLEISDTSALMKLAEIACETNDDRNSCKKKKIGDSEHNLNIDEKEQFSCDSTSKSDVTHSNNITSLHRQIHSPLSGQSEEDNSTEESTGPDKLIKTVLPSLSKINCEDNERENKIMTQKILSENLDIRKTSEKIAKTDSIHTKNEIISLNPENQTDTILFLESKVINTPSMAGKVDEQSNRNELVTEDFDLNLIMNKDSCKANTKVAKINRQGNCMVTKCLNERFSSANYQRNSNFVYHTTALKNTHPRDMSADNFDSLNITGENDLENISAINDYHSESLDSSKNDEVLTNESHIVYTSIDKNKETYERKLKENSTINEVSNLSNDSYITETESEISVKNPKIFIRKDLEEKIENNIDSQSDHLSRDHLSFTTKRPHTFEEALPSKKKIYRGSSESVISDESDADDEDKLIIDEGDGTNYKLSKGQTNPYHVNKSNMNRYEASQHWPTKDHDTKSKKRNSNTKTDKDQTNSDHVNKSNMNRYQALTHWIMKDLDTDTKEKDTNTQTDSLSTLNTNKRSSIEVVDLIDNDDLKNKKVEDPTIVCISSKKYICSKCKDIWNDNILKLLFEGNESVTVNSRITYGAIICMNVYVSIHYPEIKEQALKGLLERADLAKNLGSIKVSILNSWLIALIKNKKINCCDPFRPIYRIKSPFKQSKQEQQKLLELNNENELKTQVNNEQICSSDFSERVNSSLEKGQIIENSESDQTKELEIDSTYKQKENEKLNKETMLTSEKEPFENLNVIGIPLQESKVTLTNEKVMNKTINSKLIPSALLVQKERECLSPNLRVPYDKLLFEQKLTEEETKNLKRKFITKKEVLNIHANFILGAGKVDLDSYFKFFVQILNHRDLVLLIPDGKTLVKQVEYLRREHNRHKQFPKKNRLFLYQEWDADENFLVPMVKRYKKSQESGPIVKEILKLFCYEKNRVLLFKKNKEDFNFKNEILKLFTKKISIDDCFGLCVKLYSKYCQLLFEENEIEKAKVLKNLTYLPKNELDLLQDIIIIDPNISYLPSVNKNFDNVVSYLEDKTKPEKMHQVKRKFTDQMIDSTLQHAKKLRSDMLLDYTKSQKLATLLDTYAKLKNEISFLDNSNMDTSYDSADESTTFFIKSTANYTPEMMLMVAKLRVANIPVDSIPFIIEKVFKDILKKKMPV